MGNPFSLFLFQTENDPLNPAHAVAKSIKGNKIKASKRKVQKSIGNVRISFFSFWKTIDIYSICALNKEQIISRLNARLVWSTHTYVATCMCYIYSRRDR